jgi:hypothetical protein
MGGNVSGVAFHPIKKDIAIATNVFGGIQLI